MQFTFHMQLASFLSLDVPRKLLRFVGFVLEMGRLTFNNVIKVTSLKQHYTENETSAQLGNDCQQTLTVTGCKSCSRMDEKLFSWRICHVWFLVEISG